MIRCCEGKAFVIGCLWNIFSSSEQIHGEVRVFMVIKMHEWKRDETIVESTGKTMNVFKRNLYFGK